MHMTRRDQAILGGLPLAVGLNAIVFAASTSNNTGWLVWDAGHGGLFVGPVIDGALLLYPTCALIIFYRDRVAFWRAFSLLVAACILPSVFSSAFGPKIVMLYGMPTSFVGFALAFDDEIALSMAYLAYSVVLNSALLAMAYATYMRRTKT